MYLCTPPPPGITVNFPMMWMKRRALAYFVENKIDVWASHLFRRELGYWQRDSILSSLATHQPTIRIHPFHRSKTTEVNANTYEQHASHIYTESTDSAKALCKYQWKKFKRNFFYAFSLFADLSLSLSRCDATPIVDGCCTAVQRWLASSVPSRFHFIFFEQKYLCISCFDKFVHVLIATALAHSAHSNT